MHTYNSLDKILVERLYDGKENVHDLMESLTWFLWLRLGFHCYDIHIHVITKSNSPGIAATVCLSSFRLGSCRLHEAYVTQIVSQSRKVDSLGQACL